MTVPAPSVHRWVRHHMAEDYLRCGWVAQTTLEGTTHGEWSVHVCWICTACAPVEPKRHAET
jgi:hypothetical protein